MKLALQAVNELIDAGLLRSAAIGGAMAILFYDEPIATYDLNIICDVASSGLLIDIRPIYRYLEAKGHRTEAEAVVIDGVPVQFIPAYNALVEEALENAEPFDFQGVPTRVLTPDYLLAIAVQTNRPKDRQRVAMLTGHPRVTEVRFRDILDRHGLTPAWMRLTGT